MACPSIEEALALPWIPGVEELADRAAVAFVL
jgi:hypothetical protein